jgi:DNA mismatch repair protein MutS
MKTIRLNDSFNLLKTEPLLLSHFKVVSTENIVQGAKDIAFASLGTVIEYLYETGVTGNIAVSSVDFYAQNKFMRLDMTALRNLEIVETIRAKSKKGTLLWVLDKTKTAMGKRLIKSWLEQPLMSLNEINLRHNAVEELFGDTVMRGEIAEMLGYNLYSFSKAFKRTYGISPKNLQKQEKAPENERL